MNCCMVTIVLLRNQNGIMFFVTIQKDASLAKKKSGLSHTNLLNQVEKVI